MSHSIYESCHTSINTQSAITLKHIAGNKSNRPSYVQTLEVGLSGNAIIVPGNVLSLKQGQHSLVFANNHTNVFSGV